LYFLGGKLASALKCAGRKCGGRSAANLNFTFDLGRWPCYSTAVECFVFINNVLSCEWLLLCSFI